MSATDIERNSIRKECVCLARVECLAIVWYVSVTSATSATAATAVITVVIVVVVVATFAIVSDNSLDNTGKYRGNSKIERRLGDGKCEVRECEQ